MSAVLLYPAITNGRVISTPNYPVADGLLRKTSCFQSSFSSMAMETGQRFRMQWVTVYHEIDVRSLIVPIGRMRNPDQIRQKAMQSLKSGNGRWKPDEDQRLQEAIEQFQSSNLTHANGFMWRTIAKQVKTRDHLECRMRYMSLADNWKMRARWTGDEVATLLRCQKLLGSRWMDIARHLPGRTPRSCAAKFHSLRYYNEIDHDPS